MQFRFIIPAEKEVFNSLNEGPDNMENKNQEKTSGWYKVVPGEEDHWHLTELVGQFCCALSGHRITNKYKILCILFIEKQWEGGRERR